MSKATLSERSSNDKTRVHLKIVTGVKEKYVVGEFEGLCPMFYNIVALR